MRVVHTCSAVLLVIGATSACTSMHAPLEPTAVATVNPARELTASEQVVHVLSRLTFGARAGDAQRVAAIGVDTWIDQQVHPETIDDGVLDAALAPFPFWTEPTNALATLQQPGAMNIAGPRDTMITRDAFGTVTMVSYSLGTISVTRPPIAASMYPFDQFSAGKLIRAQSSERQLLEVMTNFWENHFSLFQGKSPSRDALIVWDRAVIRPHALGKFRELLGAVAHSPAMMWYLDNVANSRYGLNENYARELLELHSLGVDGGYTQQDVQEIARAFTGWSVAPLPRVNSDNGRFSFSFLGMVHDSTSKVVLGHTLAAGRGMQDGDEVLDIIARHPSTARFIAFKLARYFVSDEPPAALVDRAAATFTSTDGDIASVMRTIIASPEFFSRAAFRAKVKTPFELVVSARRAFSMPADTTIEAARVLGRLGQPVFGRSSPDGWPDRAAAWINAGSIKQRMVFGIDVSQGTLASFPITQWSEWSYVVSASPDQQARSVIAQLFGGIVGSDTRDALVATSGEPETRLREMIAIALGSPEFQRR